MTLPRSIGLRVAFVELLVNDEKLTGNLYGLSGTGLHHQDERFVVLESLRVEGELST